MQVTLIMSLVFAIFIALFAAINGGEVTINLFFWQLEGISQAMVILASAAFGAILVYLSGMMNKFKQSKRIKELEKKVTGLEKELATVKLIEEEVLENSTNKTTDNKNVDKTEEK